MSTGSLDERCEAVTARRQDRRARRPVQNERVDYDLTRLGPRDFEHLTQALAVRILGAGVSVFGDGRDGGREATFRGRMSFPAPDPDGPWNGYGVLQAKFRTRPLGTSADTKWFLKEVARELGTWGDPNSSRAKDGPSPDYMIFATNVVLSSVAGSGGIDRVDETIKELVAKHRLPLKGWKVWHFDQIRTFLDLNPEIRQTYDALITPADVLADLRRRAEARETLKANVRFSPGHGRGVVTGNASRNIANRLRLHHSLHSMPFGRSLIDGDSGWFVTMQRARSDSAPLFISKLMEAPWLRDFATADDCVGVEGRIVSEIAGYQRILVLRVTEASASIAYRLYEIPTDLLIDGIQAANGGIFIKTGFGFCGDFSHGNSGRLFDMRLDKSVEKIGVNLALECGIDHGTWTVELP
ncbi:MULTISPECIES: hypothetical protein [unclassified Streptomyces]|uniref:hypothetical protein n=1 Tax=Streptomyces sp. NPDC127532 TaxID=3345399 RepID=UPI00362EC8D5